MSAGSQIASLSDRELGAVLAGLRALQNVQQHEALAPEIEDVLTNGGAHEALTDDEIDALCERLNAGDSVTDFVRMVARLTHRDDPDAPEASEDFDSDTLDRLIHKARAILAPALA